MTNLSRDRNFDVHIFQLYPTCMQSAHSSPYATSLLIPYLQYGTTDGVSLYAPYTTLFLPLWQPLCCSPSKSTSTPKGDTHVLRPRVQPMKTPRQERDVISSMDEGFWREP